MPGQPIHLKLRTDIPPTPMDATPFLPSGKTTLSGLRAAAQSCRGCPLYANATQAVTAERGDHTLTTPRSGVRLLLVGEQPGDQEDLRGRAFVGPAGSLLNKALEAASIDRTAVAITNIVKHFKWMPDARGKRRLHARPTAGEARACKPWLEREIALVKPLTVACLGATAAQSLLGHSFRVTASRGVPQTGTRWARTVVATYHPSAILRAPDHEARNRRFNELVSDLRVAASAAE